ncbi:MAG: hypothetical protein V7640_2475, partial [Betaproteobacteria bacterium]
LRAALEYASYFFHGLRGATAESGRYNQPNER